MNARRLIGGILVAVLFWSLGGPADAAVQAKEVLIGVIYPFTGPAAQVGVDDRHVIEMALDIINNKHDLNMPLARTEGLPNLGGAKVRVVFADSQGKADVGQAEAERLITQEKVHALFGAWHSNVTLTSSAVAERLGIPFVNGESSSPDLTRRGFKWFFRTSPHDEHYTEAMFGFFRDFEKKKGIKLKTLAVVYEDTEFGVKSGKVMRDLAMKYGYQVVVDMQYRAKSTSLIPEVQRLKAADPDVFMPSTYQTDAVLFTKHSKELDWNPRMVMAQDAGYVDPTFVSTVGKDADGVMSRMPFGADLIATKGLTVKINELYKQRAGRNLYDFPTRCFTGFITLVDAINRAGSTDPEAIRKALIATNIPSEQIIMPWDNIRFDETGQNVGVRAIIQQPQGGKWYTVWPFDAATREPEYPFPKWSERK